MGSTKDLTAGILTFLGVFLDGCNEDLGNTQVSHTKCLHNYRPPTYILGVLQVGLLEVLVTQKGLV